MITTNEVITLHFFLQETNVCFPGIKEPGLLDSCIELTTYFETELERYSSVAYSIVSYHIFNDGNKRTAFSVLVSMNELFDDNKLADLILDAASRHLDKDEFFLRLKCCLID